MAPVPSGTGSPIAAAAGAAPAKTAATAVVPMLKDLMGAGYRAGLILSIAQTITRLGGSPHAAHP